MKQVICAALAVVFLAGCFKVLAITEADAAAYRASKVAEPVVLGHRVNAAGQFVLVTQ